MKLNKMQHNKARGITLIALVITIIVLLILAGVAIFALFGDNGLITRAQLSAYATEMKAIKENVQLKKNEHALKYATGETKEVSFTSDLEILDTNKIKLETTFLQQVQYAREGSPTDKDPSDYNEETYNKLISEDGTIQYMYVLNKEIGNGKENTYVYDTKSDIVFKIQKTTIGGKIYHCYEIAQLQKDNNPTGGDNIIDIDPEVEHIGEDYYYGPNMNGFDANNTNLVYYSDANDTNAVLEITAKEYIENGQKSKIEKDGSTYTLHDYGKKIWANAKTTANGIEAWWVWVPRYAYKINGTSTVPPIDIIYVDVDNKPLNTEKYADGKLPDGYVVQPAFTVDGEELKGIWMSKYEPSYANSGGIYGILEPDMSGFDKENTYIELYDSATDTYNQEVKLADANLSTINSDKKWHDYPNKVWANVKTNASGIEAWWVWIPRYAYKLTASSTNFSEIIFVGTDNKPINKSAYPNGELPDGYVVHPAFTVDGKQLNGIWMSKYEPSYENSGAIEGVLEPDMSGFDKYHTYIELYDNSTDTFTQEIRLADANLSTINNDKKWYDYGNKVWANIKTNANGLEAWWVWIPRYAYKLTASSTNFSEIIFVGTDNKPINKSAYSKGELPDGYVVHPAFTVDGKELNGIWMSKYEPSKVSDTDSSSIATGNADLEYKDDTSGAKHTHDTRGIGTTKRYVTSSTSWCDAYGVKSGNCNNYGYYILCSKCGVKMRHYWCDAHVDRTNLVVIDDSNLN